MKLKNIIFDMGGVLVTIDPRRSEDAFRALRGEKGKNAEVEFHFNGTLGIFDRLEGGLVTQAAFFDELRKILDCSASDKELADAWNALIIEPVRENLEYLRELKKDHRIFLLSNTNAIHVERVEDMYPGYLALFERAYMSHELKMRKPDREIYEAALKGSRLAAGETLFIDDSVVNVEGARAAGINAIHLPSPFQLGELVGAVISGA